MHKLFVLVMALALFACATVPGSPPVESAIPGIPVPTGSRQQGVFDDGSGVVMAFYTHPRLQGSQVLRFYEMRMPDRGWEPIEPQEPHPRQRSFERDGVPLLVGVEKADAGGVRFSLLRGARGDWGFMPQLREPL